MSTLNLIKKWIRELCISEFNEELYFTDIPRSDGDRLIAPAKKTQNS